MIKLSTVIAGIFAVSFTFCVYASNDDDDKDDDDVSTLENVRERGKLKCGVSTGLAGFSQPDTDNKWSGLDVDACRAVAAAVFGDADKVEYVPYAAAERFIALQSGEIDMLSRNTTWTHTRDTALGLNFVGTIYYDGQGFMVRKDVGVNSALELDGASVCVQAGTTTELNLADYFAANGMSSETKSISTSDLTRQTFENGGCDVLTSDQSQLYALRIGLEDPDSAMVLPEVISKEPLGPVVRQGDDAWFNIARWAIFALIEAEYLGINSENIDELIENSTNPEHKRFLGLTGEAGKNLGLSPEWAVNIIKQVGNYGEVFERNVGAGSPLKIARGLNAQWNAVKEIVVFDEDGNEIEVNVPAGGILYSPPIR